MSSVAEILAGAEKHPKGTWVLSFAEHKHPLGLSVCELGTAILKSECRIVLQPDLLNHLSGYPPRYRVRLMEDELVKSVDLLTLLKDFGAESDPTSRSGSVKIPVEHKAAAVEILEGILG